MCICSSLNHHCIAMHCIICFDYQTIRILHLNIIWLRYIIGDIIFYIILYKYLLYCYELHDIAKSIGSPPSNEQV